MKINLDASETISRDQRLGTIVAWDGSASELSNASEYAAGCGACGSGKKLCEMSGPFSQGSSCTESAVNSQVSSLRDAVLVSHAPIGCSASSVRDNANMRKGRAMQNLPSRNIVGVSSNLNENDMVFGGLARLEQSVRDAHQRYNPRAIFITSSCPTAIIGDDIDSVAASLTKELGVQVIPLQCEGFKSKHWSSGFDVIQHGVLRQLVKRNPVKENDLVNIVHLWGSDVFTPIFAELGLRVNYIMNLAKVEDLEKLSAAAATASFCYTLSSYIASALEQDFGVPEIKAPQPYGFAGMDAWLREIGRVTNREREVERYIAKEHQRVKPEVEKLRQRLKGIKGFIASG
jgi:nitrogenase molybdenum-iron protein alpha chain